MMKQWRKISISLIWAISAFALSCGSDSKDEKDTSSGTTYTWAADISPIIVSDCATSGCHGSTNPKSIVYQDNEANFKAAKTQVLARLALSPEKPGFMPEGQKSFDTTKKQKIFDFLSQ